MIQQAKEGDKAALNRLIDRYMPLIQSLSTRIRCAYVEKESLIQAGLLGLIQSINHYESRYNVKLITYAVPWILGEMKKALRMEGMRSAVCSLEQEREESCRQRLERIPGNAGIELSSIDLHIACEKLSGDKQQLVYLRYYRGKTQKETAAVMMKSQAQISRLESQTLDELRVMLT